MHNNTIYSLLLKINSAGTLLMVDRREHSFSFFKCCNNWRTDSDRPMSLKIKIVFLTTQKVYMRTYVLCVHLCVCMCS